MSKKSKPNQAQPTPAQVIQRRRQNLLINRGYGSLFFRIVLIALCFWLFLSQVFLITQNRGTDMFPALKDGDLVIAYRLQQDYAKDDVIVYEMNGKQYVGRIVARETDVVTMDDSGTLLVNGTAQGGEIIYPTYAKEGIAYPYTVPEHAVFVLGDNRQDATDSRDFGPVPMENVKGKAITILRRRSL